VRGGAAGAILHHCHYREELGRELAVALVPLCRRHHAAVHQRAGEFDLAVVAGLMIARSRRRWMLLRHRPGALVGSMVHR
jgi:hypothetical protein